MNIPQPPKRFGVIALLLAMLMLPVPAAFAGTNPGTPAPDFTLPEASGSVSLSAYRGKVVLVDFWASWCAPCRQSFPWMSAMLDRYASQGLVIVAVNLDKQRELAEKFLEDNPAPFVVAFDPAGETAESFHVEAMPSSFIIGRDGRVVYSHLGFQRAKANIVEDEIKEALSK